MFPNASDLERTSAGAWIISWSPFLLVLSVLTVNGSTVSQCLQSYLLCTTTPTSAGELYFTTSSGQFVRKLLQQCNVSLMRPEAEVTVNMFSKET